MPVRPHRISGIRPGCGPPPITMVMATGEPSNWDACSASTLTHTRSTSSTSLTTDEPPKTDIAPNLCPSPESVEAHQAHIPRAAFEIDGRSDAPVAASAPDAAQRAGRTSEAVENAAWGEAAP